MNSWLKRCNKTTDGSFGKLLRNGRWTILSKDEYLGDITAATCIFFDLFIHLILWTKIIKYAVTSVENWYTVSFKQMTDLAHSVTSMGLFKMESTTCKYKVKVLCFHYMLVTTNKKAPYLRRHIVLNLLVRL